MVNKKYEEALHNDTQFASDLRRRTSKKVRINASSNQSHDVKAVPTIIKQYIYINVKKPQHSSPNLRNSHS